ncbi:hypothetical protein AVEN_272161-1 [Araneus ventricosus]|uniref:Uncharacterized protein n=1 Tax=Araneus ventricosus TaxID=182803 RepID=A0A4Y2Q8Z4_ARAVE|nr:hypothetical protein AVEN_272161-1 [Araneus ventricosus]
MDRSGWAHTLDCTLTRSLQSGLFPVGHFKSLVYESSIDSDEDLVARISVAAGAVREMLGVFEKVRRSLSRRCNACITAGGRSFELFL